MSYTQSFAGIIGSVIYFESSTAEAFSPDEDSPYTLDSDGSPILKENYQQFVNHYNNTLYRDIFYAVGSAAETAFTPLEEAPVVQ